MTLNPTPTSAVTTLAVRDVRPMFEERDLPAEPVVLAQLPWGLLDTGWRLVHLASAALALAVGLLVATAAQAVEVGEPSDQRNEPRGQAHGEPQEQAEPERAASEVQRLSPIEITGSHLRQLGAQGALPLTRQSATDWQRQGITSAEQGVRQLVTQRPNFVSSTAVDGVFSGPQADQYGLGPARTLVLLNGGRLSRNAFDGASVDLNLIPLAALARTEVLHDGAAALYGSDALTGVVNFVTKDASSLGQQRARFGVESLTPQQKGGQTWRASAETGFTALDSRGLSLYVAYEQLRSDRIRAVDSDFGATAYLPQAGVDQRSSFSWPANYDGTNAQGNAVSTNPSDCHAPLSVKQADGTCKQDYVKNMDLMPQQDAHKLYLQGTYQFDAQQLTTLELLHANSSLSSHTAPAPIQLADGTRPTLPATSAYYPGAGITPGATLDGDDVTLSWRPFDLGERSQRQTSQLSHLRWKFNLSTGEWEHELGLTYSQSRWSVDFRAGYLSYDKIKQGLQDGVLNPFADYQSGAGADWMRAAQRNGRVLDSSVTHQTAFWSASTTLAQLATGPLNVVMGAEGWREALDYRVNQTLAQQAAGSGLDGAQDATGQRHAAALYTEWSVPLHPTLVSQWALRLSRYSDFGSNLSPKLALRWQPQPTWLLRSSWGRGFRAPTLVELHTPATTGMTSGSYNDPLLCPGGSVATGGVASRDCNAQFGYRSGGNPQLSAERSESFSLGMALEPSRQSNLSLDWFQVTIRDAVGALGEAAIFAQPQSYADHFVRKSDGSLAYVQDLNRNVARFIMQGVQAHAGLRWSQGSGDEWRVDLDGSYVQSWRFTNPDGSWRESAGAYNLYDGNLFAPVPRWRHSLALTRQHGAWLATLGQQWTSGYRDANNDAQGSPRRVAPYAIWNFALSWQGTGAWEFGAGVNNLFNTDPPFSNKTDGLHVGYDDRMADASGRTFFARINWRF